MSFRLKVFLIGSCGVTLLILSVFLFVPKEKKSLILEAPLIQSVPSESK